jgi:hypothetical protein
MAAFFPPNGGTLSPYLVGSFDLRNKRSTVIQLINPTAQPHGACVALFSPDGVGIPPCKRVEVKPNGLVEIVVAKDFKVKAGAFGVVKVVCLNSKKDTPEIGLVGYQRQIFGEATFTETILQPVPNEILAKDWDLIKKVCG